MSYSLQDKVVNLIPSVSLRNAIKETGYHLSDITLLATVFNYAPNFDSRIEYLKLLYNSFSGEIKAYTARIIETQHKMLDEFVKSESGVVFELHIKDTPQSYDERYLCSSFEAAMKMIPLFYQEYGDEENSLSRYHIVKRRIFSASDGEEFSEDYIGEVTLLPGEIIYSVEMDGCRAEDCDGLCFDCSRYCVSGNDIEYPCFTNDGDAVKYCIEDGIEKFGVIQQWDDVPADECYIIPLDSMRIRYHDFENVFYAHEHIPSPLVEKISADTLPQKMQEDYLAYLAYFKNECEDESR